MTKEEKRKRAKKRADFIGDVEEIALKGGAIMILFRLLYKKKIRPLTAAFLAVAMRFCNDEVAKNARENLYYYILDVDGYYDEPEKKDYKTMGFDIQ